MEIKFLNQILKKCKISKSQLYKEYMSICDKKEIIPYSRAQFFRHLDNKIKNKMEAGIVIEALQNIIIAQSNLDKEIKVEYKPVKDEELEDLFLKYETKRDKLQTVLNIDLSEKLILYIIFICKCLSDKTIDKSDKDIDTLYKNIDNFVSSNILNKISFSSILNAENEDFSNLKSLMALIFKEYNVSSISNRKPGNDLRPCLILGNEQFEIFSFVNIVEEIMKMNDSKLRLLFAAYIYILKHKNRSINFKNKANTIYIEEIRNLINETK